MALARRKFLHQLAAVGLLTPTFSATLAQKPSNAFRLTYAPHFGMFEQSAGADLLEQLRFMAANGFRALEDNSLMGRPVATQEKIGNELARLGMQMGVFVIDGGDNWKTSLTTGKQAFEDNFLATCRKAVEVAKRVNARYMTVVPGYFERNLPIEMQTANVIATLRKAAAIFEPHGLVMVLEPLSDNADLFLRRSDQSYLICKAVGSPSCKILYDIYHMQKNEGRLTYHIDQAWDEIAYFQIGDEPGRNEPTTGEINYRFLFNYLHNRATKEGRHFIFGMEHGNSVKGKAGEQKLIEAYRWSDGG